MDLQETFRGVSGDLFIYFFSIPLILRVPDGETASLAGFCFVFVFFFKQEITGMFSGQNIIFVALLWLIGMLGEISSNACTAIAH